MTLAGSTRTPLRPSRSRLRRVLSAFGTPMVSLCRQTLLFASLSLTVTMAGLRRGYWRRMVWIEVDRSLRDVAVRSLGTVMVTGILVGFALVSQGIYWLGVTGQTGLIGPILVVVLVREIAPIVVGLIVFGRSGTATLIELGEARPRGWLRLYELQGLDPLILLVLPRVVAFAIGSFCLATVLLFTTLVTGYLFGHALGLIGYSIWEFGDIVTRALDNADFVVPPLKCLTIGALVALTCCATGLSRHDQTDGLQHLVPRGFVRAALVILVVNGLFDLVI
jgi:phospholipid/cholesterol/gamma-HCH transport system permease protein